MSVILAKLLMIVVVSYACERTKCANLFDLEDSKFIVHGLFVFHILITVAIIVVYANPYV